MIKKAVNETTKIIKKEKKFYITPWWKEILLMSINAIFIAGLFFFLTKLPERARLVKEQRNSSGVSLADLKLGTSKFEIDTASEKFEKLNLLLPDQKKLIDFLSEVDVLKTTGNVAYFSFASEGAVKEKSGYLGYPFVIEFNGTLSQVSDGLYKFEKLPFLFRVINFSIETGEKENLVILRYGGFLYVREQTPKN